MAVTFRTTVYRRNISWLMQHGDGAEWIYQVSDEMLLAAQAEAPSRSGTLKRSHDLSREVGTNQYAARYSVQNTAEHAGWVHGGTPYITGLMRVPKRPGPVRGQSLPKGQVFWTDGLNGRPMGVRGQKANPWLDRACSRVAMRYGAIPVSL